MTDVYCCFSQENFYPATPVSEWLAILRIYSDFYQPHIVLYALFLTGLLMTLTLNALFPDSSLTQVHTNDDTEPLGSPNRKGKKEEVVEGIVRKRNRNKNH